jgi:DNA-binding Lrp family transcriptional regulator
MPGKPRLRDANAYEAKLLDAVNLRLLDELSRDGRVGIAELGRRVGLSAPAVAERVQRLERAGVITGYHAEIDPGAVGWPVSAVVRIRPSPGSSSGSQRSRARAPRSPSATASPARTVTYSAFTFGRSMPSRTSSTASRPLA